MSRRSLFSARLLTSTVLAAALAGCGMKHEPDDAIDAEDVAVSSTQVDLATEQEEAPSSTPAGTSAAKSEVAQTASTRGAEGDAAAAAPVIGGRGILSGAADAAPPPAKPAPRMDADSADASYAIAELEATSAPRREAKLKKDAKGGPTSGGASRARPASPGALSSGDLAALGYVVSAPADPATQGSEVYTDHGVNGFTMVGEDALSTFSIDVDTASYSIARRKLNEGALPPQAAVRVEEFVNYFDYDYVAPKDDPFAVNMEAMPDPFRPGHHILRVGVQGKELLQSERPTMHLTFLVDVSGSMSSPDKLPMAKQSLHMLVDTMREGDTVALGTYAGRTARILAPTDVTNKRAIHDAIDGLSSSGGTAMSSGIDMAYQMAWDSFEEGAENRVVVISDGDANIGRTSWDDMLSQIKGYADKGVTLSTIGVGMGNYKDTLMEQLANKGDGNNFYIDSQAQAQRVFVEEMGGSMITIARDVKIQVEFNDESVVAYRLIGYENRDIADVDFRNDRVDAGEVGSGHNVTALYDVILRDGYERSIANVRMRYEKPGKDSDATEKLWVFQDKRLQETTALTSRDTRIAYSAATFAEVLRGSPHASEIDLDQLIAFAKQSKRAGEKDDDELIDLMKKANRLGADDFDASVSMR